MPAWVRALSVAVAAALAACTHAPPQSTPVRTAAYVCGDGARLEMLVEGQTAMRLFPPGRATVALRRVRAASGARYRGAGAEVWDKGGRALYDPADGPRVRCDRLNGKASWAEAAADGADFRALGQEPGWIATVSDGRLRAELDYGSRTVTALVEHTETAGGTVWSGEAEAGALRLTARDELCRDAMSGHAFPTTVVLELDGARYAGCGRWLVVR